MKQFAARFLLFFSLALMVCAITACKTTSETERPQASTVIGLAGHARYRDGDSGKWHAVKLGNFIPQGSVIQTGEEPTNALALAIGSQIQFLPSPYHPDFKEDNHLTLYGNSTLKLDHVSAKTISGKKISDIRLVLSSGKVHCDIGYIEPTDVFPSPPTSKGPKLETIKPRSGKSYFEIRGSNIVVHAEHAGLFFSPAHGASLLMGVAALEFTDTGVTKDLFGYQRYDFVTGEISDFEIKETSSSTLTAEPRFKWLRIQPADDSPRFSVPQRPF